MRKDSPEIVHVLTANPKTFKDSPEIVLTANQTLQKLIGLSMTSRGSDHFEQCLHLRILDKTEKECW